MTTLSDLYDKMIDEIQSYYFTMGRTEVLWRKEFDAWVLQITAGEYEPTVKQFCLSNSPRFKAIRAINTYLIARDKSIQEALLWKLSYDG